MPLSTGFKGDPHSSMHLWHDSYPFHLPSQPFLFLAITHCLGGEKKKNCTKKKVVIRFDYWPFLIDDQIYSSLYHHNPKYSGYLLSFWVFTTFICVYSLIQVKFTSSPSSFILYFGTLCVSLANSPISLISFLNVPFPF